MREIATHCSPGEWNHLSVRLNGGRIEVGLNGRGLFVYNNTDTPLSKGKTALRTWNSTAEFRNLNIETEDDEVTVSYDGTVGLPVSVRTGTPYKRRAPRPHSSTMTRMCTMADSRSRSE